MKYLDLSFCNINNQFNIIFQGLSENKNLKLINLSGNNIPMKKETLNDSLDKLKEYTTNTIKSFDLIKYMKVTNMIETLKITDSTNLTKHSQMRLRSFLCDNLFDSFIFLNEKK